MFRAGLCNRLDRNTSGLILAGKTVAATQQLSELIAERAVGKYYLTVVKGTVTETERIRGYLTKNERTNRVSIQREQQGDAVYIETAYRPLCAGRGCTLLEVELVTGKSHQIRAISRASVIRLREIRNTGMRSLTAASGKNTD